MGIREFQYGNRELPAWARSPGFTGSSSWNSQVSWTGRERIRCLGYRFRLLAVEEVNYAARRMVEPQTRLP
jgi:hypothetical protein